MRTVQNRALFLPLGDWPVTFHDSDRSHMLGSTEQAGWRIDGLPVAAIRLGMPLRTCEAE